MAKKKSCVPVERILESAAELFAKKGFSAVGIREIASSAKVNISMISYYFGGKIGLLKAIVAEYFKLVDGVTEGVVSKNLSSEETLRDFVNGMVNILRKHENLCKVALIEMPIELPQITKMKVELLLANMRLMGKNISETYKIKNPEDHIIIGPAFLSMIYSHFLLGSIIKKASKQKFNDNFYKKYSEIISSVFLNGISGFTNKQKKKA